MQNSSTSLTSARSPIAWPRDSFAIWLSAVVAIGAILVIFAAGIAAVALALAGGTLSLADLQHRPPRLPANFQLWSQFAVYVPVAAYLLVVVRPLARMPLRDLGVRMPTASEIGIGALGAVAMWIAIAVSGVAVEALTHRHDTEAAIELIKQIRTPVQRLEFGAIAVLLAPLIEEFAFRVFLFNAFRRHGPFWIAAVGSGFLFGLAHAQTAPQIVTVSIPLTFGGIVLAAVYERTRCYWASVTSHCLFNAVQVAAVFIFGVKP